MTREERKQYNFWLTRREVNGVIEKQCSICRDWKEETLDNFYLMNKSKPELGYSASCRKCLTDKLQARNSYQILGLDLNTPSNFVICWTKNGKGSGGTGQAIRIARAYNIPIFDAGYWNDIEDVRKELKLFLIENGVR